MKKLLIDELKLFLHSENGENLCGIPASDEEILNAETILNIKFSNDYIQFIKLFGGAWGGFDIHAFKNGSMIGRETVIEMTKWLRESHPDVIDSYVISDDGSGNPIMIDKSGKLLIYYHDCGEIEVLADSLGDFIEKTFVPI